MGAARSIELHSGKYTAVVLELVTRVLRAFAPVRWPVVLLYVSAAVSAWLTWYGLDVRSFFLTALGAYFFTVSIGAIAFVIGCVIAQQLQQAKHVRIHRHPNPSAG